MTLKKSVVAWTTIATAYALSYTKGCASHSSAAASSRKPFKSCSAQYRAVLPVRCMLAIAHGCPASATYIC